MVTIRLRPHHLTAIGDYIYSPWETVEGLKNQGYSSEYIENERRTIWKILTEKDCKVEIVPALDDLCRACHPKRMRCFQNDPAGVMGYMEELGLHVGGTYLGRDIVRKIQDTREIQRAFREAQRR